MVQARQRAQAPMATTIGILACCALVGWAGPARAQVPAAIGSTDRVFVLDLVDSGVGKDTAKKVTDVLRTELAAVTGDRVVRPSAVAAIITRPEVAEQVRCPRETYVECAAAVGQKISVNFVIAGVVAALGDAQLVDLRLVDVRARAEINRLQTPLTGNAERDRSALRELGVRLVAPDSWVGTLELNGLEPGDQVMVDGTQMAASPPRAKLDLAVGSHAVSVSRGDKSLLTQVVEIKYGETAALALAGGGAGAGASGAQAAAGGRWPMWSVFAAGGTAVVAIIVTGLFVYDLTVGFQRDRDTGEPISTPQAFKTADDNYKLAVKEKIACPVGSEGGPIACYERAQQQALAFLVLDIAGAAGFGIASVAAPIAAVVFFMMASGEDAEAPAPGPAPSTP